MRGLLPVMITQERLGHAKMATTEGYLHTLPSADETALTALGRIRGSGAADEDAELVMAKREIEELKAALVTVTLRLTQTPAAAL
jgi:hypothetical protein